MHTYQVMPTCHVNYAYLSDYTHLLAAFPHLFAMLNVHACGLFVRIHILVVNINNQFVHSRDDDNDNNQFDPKMVEELGIAAAKDDVLSSICGYLVKDNNQFF